MCVCVCVCVCTNINIYLCLCLNLYILILIYCKEFAHMITQFAKSPGLQSARLNSRRSDGLTPVLRPAGSRPQEELMSKFESEVRERLCLSSSPSGRRSSLFLSLFGLFGLSTHRMSSTHIREDNPFDSIFYSNVNLTRNTLTDTPRIMFDQMFGHPLDHSS